MTGDDLAKLLRWLYGDANGERWLAPAATGLRINPRRLRAMMGGKEAIPEALARAVPVLVAAHCRLNGWQEAACALDSLGLSNFTLDRIIQWRAKV